MTDKYEYDKIIFMDKDKVDQLNELSDETKGFVFKQLASLSDNAKNSISIDMLSHAFNELSNRVKYLDDKITNFLEELAVNEFYKNLGK